MSALQVAGLAACVLATVPAGLRWLRVAQREHYLFGAASRFAWRWWSASPAQATLAMIAAAAAVTAAAAVATSLGASPHGAGSLGNGFAFSGEIVAAMIVAAGPRSLGVRGRTAKLRWTRRLTTIGVGLAVLLAAAIGIGAALGGVAGAGAAAALALVLVPLMLDAVLGLLTPVEDCLARRHVDRAAAKVAQFAPEIVAITGSYGKTTTKSYLAHLLGGRFNVVASPRSYNNRAGLARTVNELLVPGSEVLIAEMGAYGPGEIAELCSWLPPKIAVITAIGPVHLERFKSLDRTVAAKAEITERAELAVLNVDDERLAALADRLAGRSGDRSTRASLDGGPRVLRCSGIDPSADVAVLVARAEPSAPGQLSALEIDARASLQLYRNGVLEGSVEVDAEALPGATSNAACAAAVALALGCDPAEVLGRMASLPAPASRLATSRTPNGAIVLDDTFNANPAGAALALALLERRAGPASRRFVVTPGMVELGSEQARENAAFAEAAAGVATAIVVVGRTNKRSLTDGVLVARADGAVAELHYAATRDEAVAFIRAELGPNDIVLYENDLPDHFP